MLFPWQVNAFVCVGVECGGGQKEGRVALGTSLVFYFKSKAVQGDKDPHATVSCGEPLLLSSVAFGVALFSLLF